MKAYILRNLLRFQQSTILPIPWRVPLLRALGMRISADSMVSSNVFFGSNKVAVGKGCHINVGCFLDGNASISIADGVRIGPQVVILTGTHEIMPSVFRRNPKDLHCLPVSIERGCWIGTGALILPGISIREGCVIAARAVVIADTLPNGLYAGNPARRKRDLPVTADVDATLSAYADD